MNKEEFIDAVVTQLAKKDDLFYKYDEIQHIYEVGFEVLVKALKKDGYLLIKNFGKVSIKRRARHKARNPRNNEVIYVPAHNTIHFTAGKRFRDSIQ